MIRILIAVLLGFALSLGLTPLVRMLAKKLKLRQTILHYVDNHSAKSGTPTMGGIAFIIAFLIAGFCLIKGAKSIAIVTLIVTLGYGIVGFLDDFIKVYFKRNEGLTPWQKIIFQLVIAVIVSVYAYYNPLVGDEIILPFSLKTVSLSYFSIPVYIIVYLACTNAVNLTDGLDGLASGVSCVYIIGFGIIASIVYLMNGSYAEEYINLIIVLGALAGALLGFLCFNCHPASIFMGDTGALALGGAVACSAIFSKLMLYIPLIGIIYFVTALSVIMQVGYYKLTKKRIFLMAPLHHHFERKGFKESKIVGLYMITTAVVAIGVILITLCFNQA